MEVNVAILQVVCGSSAGKVKVIAGYFSQLPATSLRLLSCCSNKLQMAHPQQKFNSTKPLLA